MNLNRAKELVGNFDKQVLVIGDVILDKFIHGNVNRFSPEAPSCVVLDQEREINSLGGAGNTAANLIDLGARCVRLCGFLGFDQEGQQVRLLLERDYNGERGIADNTHKTSRCTTVKTRFVSQDNKHLLRHDKENIFPTYGMERDIMLAKFKDAVKHVSAVIVSDYNKGVITADVLRDIIDVAEGRGIPVFIDPKKEHWEHFRGAEVVTPNINEAYAALGKPVPTADKVAVSIDDVGSTLLKYTRAKSVIITRGSDGMSFYGENNEISWAIPKQVNVVDVSGAGDTTMAALALSRLAGATWQEAMILSNLAAGIAIGKSGTATVTAEELLSKFIVIEK